MSRLTTTYIGSPPHTQAHHHIYRLTTTRRVLRRRGAIDAAGCAALRAAGDARRDVTRDSVDRMAQVDRQYAGTCMHMHV